MGAMREEIAVGRASLGVTGDTRPWPVWWSAVWVGALSAIAMVLLFGLLGIALGAYVGVPVRTYPTGREFGIGALIMSVIGAFLAFVVGGWVAGKVVGAGPAEKTMLHAAIAWLVAVPFLMGFAALGSGVYFGTWYSGLAGVPTWVATPPGTVVSPEAVRVARMAASGALTALLLGLVGAVIGGWMASGEPMTLTYYRTRDRGRPYPGTL